jgi:hypothetical protein
MNVYGSSQSLISTTRHDLDVSSRLVKQEAPEDTAALAQQQHQQRCVVILSAQLRVAQCELVAERERAARAVARTALAEARVEALLRLEKAANEKVRAMMRTVVSL